jgi:alpha-mannosidase
MDDRQPPASTPEACPSRVLIALVPDDGREPTAKITESRAQAVWAAVSALWHPALLSVSTRLPTIEEVEYPSAPLAGEVRLVAGGSSRGLPSGYTTQAEDAGAVLLEGEVDRERLVDRLRERLGLTSGPDDAESAAIGRDFLALGTAAWWLRDVTLGMGHVDCLDHDSLAREVLAGARCWLDGDRNGASARLRAAFELLTEARERFFPVDAYLLDLILLDPSTPAGVLEGPLSARAPFTLIATAQAIEAQAKQAPETIRRLCEAISENWADVAGGTYAEVDEPFRPLESVRWQYRQGSAVYREHLDRRDVETFARRRSGMHPHLPGLARRFGIRFAAPLAFDGGTFPIQVESKKLWEGLDGTALEAMTRPPLAADRASSGALLAWRLARSMKEDQVAVLPLAHWPEPVAPWFVDLRRVAAYSPVLVRWVTLSDFFHLTDRPWEAFRPNSDAYRWPFLEQAVARGDTEPISTRVRHHALRARLDALCWLQTVAQLLGAASPDQQPGTPSLTTIENDLEQGRHDQTLASLEAQEPAWAAAAADAITGGGQGGRPGYLVFNPLGVPRRSAVRLPDGAPADLRPEGPLRAAQLTEEGTWSVLELPPLGYVWVPGQTDHSLPPFSPGAVTASRQGLRNEAIEVDIDRNTGGIRGLKALGEPSARLGQQLVVVGLTGPDSQPLAVQMRGEGCEVEHAGPALAQIVSRGVLIDPKGRPIARFAERLRLWTGRPILDLEIELRDLAPDLSVSLASQGPWAAHLACRWAWPDPQATLRRSSLLAMETTSDDRPETPDMIEIATRKQRTALLFGGLAHHRRHGPRMLDTLLVAGRESARRFRLGVALDLGFPFHAALERHGPTPVVTTSTGPPSTGMTGWLFLLDSQAVALTRLEFAEQTGDGRGWGVIAHVQETDNRPVRCRLRCFRDPTWARQVDEHGEPIVDLAIDGDAVLIDLTPYELARIEITLV